MDWLSMFIIAVCLIWVDGGLLVGYPSQEVPADCREGDFLCEDKSHCIHIRYRCNGKRDCEDNSDELDCADFKLAHPSCHDMIPGGFPCDDGVICLIPQLVCDGTPNCMDGSDEKFNCSVQCNKYKNCKSCFPVSKEQVNCKCQDGYELRHGEKDSECVDIDECSHGTSPVCSQRCINSNGSFRCDCQGGYWLTPDKTTCKAYGSEPIIILSTMDEIYTFSLATRQKHLIKSNLNGIHGLAVDSVERIIYWSESAADDEHPGIYHLSLKGHGNFPTNLAFFGWRSPHSIAYDYISKSLYVVDSDIPAIIACSLKTRCVTLFNSSVLEHPTEIVLHLEKSTMYWIDRKTPVIMSGSMDGKSYTEFLSNLHRPESLTLDLTTDTLFWSDGLLNTITSIKLDGSNRKLVVSHTSVIPSTIAVFEDTLFWATEERHKVGIHSANKFTGNNASLIIDDVPLPTALIIDHEVLQIPPEDEHPCSYNDCDMCLRGQDHSFTCVCASGQKPSKSGLTCVDSMNESTYLFVLSGHTVLQFLITTSGVSKFHELKTDGQATELIAYVSGSNEIFCINNKNEDESYINKLTNLTGTPRSVHMFQAYSLTVLAFDESSSIFYAYAYQDFDAKETIKVVSLNGQYKATLPIEDAESVITLALDIKNRKMYLANSHVTGAYITECLQDGTECMTFVHENLIWPNHILVHEDRVYWSDFEAYSISSIDVDGHHRKVHVMTDTRPLSIALKDDLVFWVDEFGQLSYMDISKPSLPLKIKMQNKVDGIIIGTENNYVLDSACLAANGGCEQICVPKPDGVTCLCGNEFILREDGKSCGLKPGETTCAPNEFKCRSDGMCLDASWVCDEDHDCQDDSDEDPAMCSGLVKTCPPNHFQCVSSGVCLDLVWKCDGIADCSDDSDENPAICPPLPPCKDDEFRCDLKECFPKSKLCDEDFDCIDGTDEVNCPCSPDQFTCGSGDCIPTNWLCDGIPECDDGSDERNCTDKCGPNKRSCSDSTTCLDKSLWCDGKPDCPDSEDEICEGAEWKYLCEDDMIPCSTTDLLPDCVSKELLCDGKPDCPDTGRDEDHEVCGIFGANSARHCAGKFSCRSGVCIDWSLVCNSRLDCPDGADEHNCNACEHLGCSQKCIMVTEGPKCVCESGYRLLGKIYCEDVDECQQSNGWCSQKCVNEKGSHRCMCHPGYKLLHDGRTCFATAGPKYMYVVATKTDIQLMQQTHIIQNLATVTADNNIADQHIDINVRTDEVFWLQSGSKSTEVYTNSGKESKPIIHGLIGTVGGIALDWITGNIYLTEENGILLHDAHGLHRTVLHKHMYKLGDIVLYPAKGMMYWISLGDKHQLMSSWMNGRQAKVLFTFDFPAKKLALSLDPATQRLFVKQSPMDEIFSIGIDGKNSHIKKLDGLASMDKLDVFESVAHMSTSWKQHLAKVRTFDPGMQKESLSMGFFPLDLKVKHVQKQPLSENPCEHKACMYICVIVPKGAMCLCPAHVKQIDRLNPSCEGDLSETSETKAPVPKLVFKAETSECSLSCINGGNCTSSVNGSYCSCPSGFTGLLCERNEEQSGHEEQGSLAWIAGLVIGLIVLAALIALGVCFSRQRRYSPSLMKTIKFKNPRLGKPKKEDKEDLVPEISFGNPGFRDEIDADIDADHDWWKRLLTRSKVSMDSHYISKCGTDLGGDLVDPELPPPVLKDPNANLVYDKTRLLK